jgi:diguanylate cyclase (GGDEF)-like protein
LQLSSILRRYRWAAVRGLLQAAPFILAAAASIACIRYDGFERLGTYLQPYDAHEFDELVLSAVFFLFAACCWIAQRKLLINSDVQRGLALERQWRDLIRQDPLTGLPNRRAFREALEEAGPAADLLLINLDGFRKINDWSGHLLGDKVLVEVATRLKKARDRGRLTTVARVGGDEFACLCSHDAEGVAEELMHSISVPMLKLPEMPHVTPSIGIVCVGSEKLGFDSLLRFAEAAMQEAKLAGGAAVRRFHPSLGTGEGTAATPENESHKLPRDHQKPSTATASE